MSGIVRKSLFAALFVAGTLLVLCAQESPVYGAAAGQFEVRRYGATGDGQTKDTAAIQKAIDACSESGGGTVYFAPGNYISGSLHIRSNVTLYLDTGATLLESPDNEDFDPYEELNYKTDSDEETTYFHYSLIWGENVEKIAILGQGTIDGNRKKRHGPKPIAFKRCRDIAIRDITIRNSPNYCISLLGCDYVNIDGVTALNNYCDGIDPDSCRNVRISNCHIESWDDAIVPKCSFALGEHRSTENLTVTNCILVSSCNSFKLGTESGGGFKRIAVSNCVMISPDTRPTISGIALESVDGAEIEGVVISNITMLGVRTPIFLRLGNRGRDMETPVPGYLRNVSISNVEAIGGTMASSITGIPGHPVEHVTISNVRLWYKGGGPADLIDRVVPEVEEKYPEATMFGELPVYGLYCRHAKNILLRDFQVGCVEPDQRPPFLFDDLEQLHLSGLSAENPVSTPFIWMKNVRKAFLNGIFAPENVNPFLKVQGENSSQISVIANSPGKKFEIGSEVPKGAVIKEGE
ncbi:MAG TPA: glycoside hydrolase family 28 protein [bacterium]|nr:glycoside hydrolase family 28 protein [bacterium]HQL62471.1 glycoside hydrolase family 28 protein [bacterium]